MTRTFSLALICALPLVFSGTAAGSKPTVPEPSVMVPVVDKKLTKTLTALLAARGAAVVADDPKLLPNMKADFVGTGFNGTVVDLETWIEIHFAPEPGFTRFEPAQTLAWHLAPNAAVLIGKLVVETGGESPEKTENRFTAIYLKVDGQWLEAVYHESRL